MYMYHEKNSKYYIIWFELLLWSHGVVFEDFHSPIYIVCDQTLLNFDTAEQKFGSGRPHVWEQLTFNLNKRKIIQNQTDF